MVYIIDHLGLQNGRPYRSRTCDTLIKSQVVKFFDFGQCLKLESA